MLQRKSHTKKQLLCAYLLLTIILCTACGGKKERYSCQNIPIGDGKLSWGMNADEIMAVLGSPLSEEDVSVNGACMIYEYGTPVECGLGKCSGVALYVAQEKEGIGGLVAIEMTVDATTKASVVEKLTDFYGELSPDSGSTKLEGDLKKANPDYFNEAYWCDAWALETLTDEEFDRMADAYSAMTEDGDASLKKDALLMDVNISGIQSEDRYSCVIRLYGNKICLFENLEL
ncbi:MAG: hypothetical protein K2P40_00115 [Lachnospiraceae bacterium]|nr:hypothetical protein [Lachnospiraceae bacterium]